MLQIYKFLDDGKCSRNDKMTKEERDIVKNAIILQISTVGAMGRGGLAYFATEDGREAAFDFYTSKKQDNTVYIGTSPLFDEICELQPYVESVLNCKTSSDFRLLQSTFSKEEKWDILYSELGWYGMVKSDYKEMFDERCEEMYQNSFEKTALVSTPTFNVKTMHFLPIHFQDVTHKLQEDLLNQNKYAIER